MNKKPELGLMYNLAVVYLQWNENISKADIKSNQQDYKLPIY